MGGGGGAGVRLGWRACGERGDRDVAEHHPQGVGGTGGREATPDAPMAARLRRPGGGRKRRTEADPDLLPALERLVEPATRGDPKSPLRWTCKSTTRLAEELTRQGHPVSPRTVAAVAARGRATACRATARRKEGGGHPDRDAQFEHINATRRARSSSAASR